MYSRFSLFNFSIRPFDGQKELLGQNKDFPFALWEFSFEKRSSPFFTKHNDFFYNAQVFLLQIVSLSLTKRKFLFLKA